VGDDPIDAIDPSGLQTQVILWNPVGWFESSQGHVSTIIDDLSYSWGPGKGNSVLNKCCEPGEMDIEPAQQFLNKNTAFRDGLGYVLNLTDPQEAGFRQFLKNYSGDYTLWGRNCGNPVVEGLDSVGIHLNLPWHPNFNPLSVFPETNEPQFLTPNDLDYAFGHTPGVVNGWIPHPKQGN
jgi:hypothetical protein